MAHPDVHVEKHADANPPEEEEHRGAQACFEPRSQHESVEQDHAPHNGGKHTPISVVMRTKQVAGAAKIIADRVTEDVTR